MKFQFAAIAALICAVTATPVPIGAPLEATRLEARQDGGETSNDLTNGICRTVTLIFARGSLEPGNMGEIVGPQLCTDLQSLLGASNVACQGVGSPYDANIQDNTLPQNTSPTDIGAATTLFDLAHTQCPNTQVVAGGYSQGSAVMDGSIQALPAAIQSQVKATVLFGYTRNKQDGGRIPNYPTSQTKIYCAFGDLVCNGTLIITIAHLSYGDDAQNAASFLAGFVTV